MERGRSRSSSLGLWPNRCLAELLKLFHEVVTFGGLDSDWELAIFLVDPFLNSSVCVVAGGRDFALAENLIDVLFLVWVE
jgi:hypothetical protein